MELTAASLSVFVRLAGVIFGKALEVLPSVARASGIFQVDSIPANAGNTRDFTEIDLNLFAARKDEGNQAGRAKVQLGYNKVVSDVRFARDIGITYEMRTQNKYSEVVRRLTNLAAQAQNRMELDLSHRLGFGTATSYVDADGSSVDISVGDTLSLFSTAHTLTGSASTYRNRLAGNPALSKGALEGMELLIVEQTMNNLGEKVTMPFDILWITDDPNTKNTAMEYLRSVAAPDAINAGVENVYKGKYRLVSLPYVATTAVGAPDTTKRKYWGLASSSMSDLHLAVWEEPHLKSPSEGSNAEDFATDNWQFGVRAGWGIGCVTGRAIKLSSGDGTA